MINGTPSELETHSNWTVVGFSHLEAHVQGIGDNFIKMINETPSELETHSNGTLVSFSHLEAQFVHGQTGQMGFRIGGHFERFVV